MYSVASVRFRSASEIPAFRSTFLLSYTHSCTEIWLSFEASFRTPSDGLVFSLPRFQRWGIMCQTLSPRKNRYFSDAYSQDSPPR